MLAVAVVPDLRSHFERLLGFFFHFLHWSCGTESSSRLSVESCSIEHLSHERSLHVPEVHKWTVPEIEGLLGRVQGWLRLFVRMFEGSHGGAFENVIQDKM